jgi:hypothetical protein
MILGTKTFNFPTGGDKSPCVLKGPQGSLRGADLKWSCRCASSRFKMGRCLNRLIGPYLPNDTGGVFGRNFNGN